MGVVAVIEATKYDKWMVNEYNGKYSLVDCWKNQNDEYIPNFCEIKNRKSGDMMKIPKGLGGRFDDLSELRAMLVLLVKKIDAYDEGEPQVPVDPTDDGDIPF